MSLEDGELKDEIGPLMDAMNRAEQEKKASSSKSPEAQAVAILERLWNREEATEENALTDNEALVLLLYGESAGEQLVEDEIEHGRYRPDADVQALLDKKRAQGGGAAGMH